jgi:uncharacterized Zn-binding protein involved in type VI secretion
MNERQRIMQGSITFKNVHISTIRAGDTVLIGGELTTVCENSLTRIEGMGVALFGDTYNLGYRPIIIANMGRAVP